MQSVLRAQRRLAREASRIRGLFPDGAYVEGWGSFVEELMLDAGWADDAPLTRLAEPTPAQTIDRWKDRKTLVNRLRREALEAARIEFEQARRRQGGEIVAVGGTAEPPRLDV